MLKAIKYFDESKNIKFSTFATVCIKNSINKYFQDKNLIKNRMEKFTISLNEPLFKNRESDEELTLESSVVIEDPSSFVEDFIRNEEVRDVLKNFKYLTPNQQVCLRYSVQYEGECVGEMDKIYKKLGFTKQYFSVNVINAKRKLQLIYKSKKDCTIEELQERARILRTEYPIVKSIEEWKKYKAEKKKPLEK